MPGDPVDMILPTTATPEEREAKREELGLNDPIPVQFFNYVKGIVTELDFGTSYKTDQPVFDELMQRFPITFVLAVGSVLLGTILAVPLGVLSAVKQYTWVDSLILVISMLAVSIPGFWLALMFLFSLGLSNLAASINLFIRDYQPMQSLIFQGLFYATPIIFPASMLEEKGFSYVYKLNPFYYLLEIWEQAKSLLSL